MTDDLSRILQSTFNQIMKGNFAEIKDISGGENFSKLAATIEQADKDYKEALATINKYVKQKNDGFLIKYRPKPYEVVSDVKEKRDQSVEAEGKNVVPELPVMPGLVKFEVTNVQNPTRKFISNQQNNGNRGTFNGVSDPKVENAIAIAYDLDSWDRAIATFRKRLNELIAEAVTNVNNSTIPFNDDANDTNKNALFAAIVNGSEEERWQNANEIIKSWTEAEKKIAKRVLTGYGISEGGGENVDFIGGSKIVYKQKRRPRTDNSELVEQMDALTLKSKIEQMHALTLENKVELVKLRKENRKLVKELKALKIEYKQKRRPRTGVPKQLAERKSVVQSLGGAMRLVKSSCTADGIEAGHAHKHLESAFKQLFKLSKCIGCKIDPVIKNASEEMGQSITSLMKSLNSCDFHSGKTKLQFNKSFDTYRKLATRVDKSGQLDKK